MGLLALAMFAVAIAALLLGFPVAFTLGAVALLFGGLGLGLDFFALLPHRIWGIMTNFTLLAVPLFIFMGVVLEKAGLAEDLLQSMGGLFGRVRGGLAVSVVLVGGLLAATTGVVGATVVTMGIIALPAMLKHGYDPRLATSTVAASGTLGQIVPPSVVLILLGDVMGVPVGRLFMGAVGPGCLLVGLFVLYVLATAWRHPERAPAVQAGEGPGLGRVLAALVPPLVLIVAVLGSIFFGVASPTESAAVGGLGALLLAGAHRRLTLALVREAGATTTRLTSMVFLILIGATAFGLIFRGLGGDALVYDFFSDIPGGRWTFIAASMLLLFLLGFFLDFLEILFIVVPVLTPIAAALEIDLLWFAVLIAVNLQASFITPPFGFSLFYLKAVAPPEIGIQTIYRGIVPFIVLQVLAIAALAAFPAITLWLPAVMDQLAGLS